MGSLKTVKLQSLDSNMTLDEMQAIARNSLVGKLNGVIRSHYPEGAVDYVETVRALVSLAVSYQKGLQALSEGKSPHDEPQA